MQTSTYSNRNTSKRRITATTLSASAALALFLGVACGSKTSESGPPPAAGCTAGDTRTCVGPGACQGGQLCGNDGTWSECDCGAAGSGGAGAGGTSGAGGSSAGSSGNAGASNSGGTSSGGASGSAGNSGGGASGSAGNSGGAAGEAGVAGEAGTTGVLPDEPCPADLAADCSGQCPATSPDACYSGKCPGTTASIEPTQSFRTPSRPGPTQCVCNRGGPAISYNMVVAVSIVAASHVAVTAPWVVSPNSDGGCGGISTTCINLNPGTASFWLMTTDPNAPAINVKIEPGACP